ncbi:MAG: PKD domain-containing protein, partial [Gemmatimonadaceae bacterium]
MRFRLSFSGTFLVILVSACSDRIPTAPRSELTGLSVAPLATHGGLHTFCNTTPIIGRDQTSALPFPSPVVVAGIPSGPFKVTATINNMNYPSGFAATDLEMLLVGPNNATVMLISDLGTRYSSATLTFDDGAATGVGPASATLTGAHTFRPTNNNVGQSPDNMPGGNPFPPPHGALLAPLGTAGANGTWRLYVWDDAVLGVGNTDGGWCVNITSLNTAPVANADGPYSGAEGDEIQFDGSLSTDAENNIVSYAWDFGDGNTGSGISPTHAYATGGTFTVTLTVTDAEGLSSQATSTTTIAEVAPTAAFNAPAEVNEGNAADISLTDATPGSRFAFDCGNGYGPIGTESSTSCPTLDNGVLDVQGKVVDATIDGVFTEYSAAIEVKNVAPIATFANNGPVIEGSSIIVQLNDAQDVAADLAAGLRYAFDCGAGFGPSQESNAATCPTSDNGTVLVKGKVMDKDEGSSEYTANVVVTNAPPVLGAIAGIPAAPVPVGTVITIQASFTDPGTGDTHVGAVSWGAGEPFETAAIAQDAGSGVVSASRALPAGVHTVSLRVTDDDGASATVSAEAQFIVVFDPAAGHVTGGGWIQSPAGAYDADPSLAGKATFGFVAKYQPGA